MLRTCLDFNVLTSILKNIFVKKTAYSISQYPCTVIFPENLHMFFIVLYCAV